MAPAPEPKAAEEVADQTSPGRLDAYLERVAPDVVGVTYWFDPPPEARSVTIRLAGRRLDVGGRPGQRDQFVHEETVEGVVAGSGPIAVTSRVRDINAGEWEIDAGEQDLRPELDGPPTSQRGSHPRTPEPARLQRASWSWRRWQLQPGLPTPVHTCLAPLARAPGTLFGIWGVLAVAGIAVALGVQAHMISSLHLHLRHVLTVSLLAIAVGIIGAKAWYVVLHRHDRKLDGWCIQGLVVGVTATAVTLLGVTHTPIGVFLDASAPALMFGMAVGRVGCFFAGCCVGRLTASRWGVWSSDRRVGARRVPTQLMESALALSVGLGALEADQIGAHLKGGVFLAALGTYSLVRQAILRLRLEPRRSTLVGLLTAAGAAASVVAGVTIISMS